MKTIEYAHFIVPDLREMSENGRAYPQTTIAFFEQHISNYHFMPGDPVPPYRKFAQVNGIGRSCAWLIYDQLKTKGLIELQHNKRYRIAPRPTPGKLPSNFEKDPASTLPLFQSLKAQVIQPPCFIEAGVHSVRMSLLKKNMLSKYLAHVMHKEIGKKQGQILDLKIQPQILNELMLEHLRRNTQLLVLPEQMVLIKGRYESLLNVFQLLERTGMPVVNTQPYDPLVSNTIQSCCAEVLDLELHSEGFMEQLRELLRQRKISFLYLRAQCSYPQGFTLPEERAAELIVLAKEHNFYIIDESEDHEFWFARQSYKTMAAMPHAGHVVYLHALSKLTPELAKYRFVCAHQELSRALREHYRQRLDDRPSNEDAAVAEMLRNSDLMALQRTSRNKLRRELKQLKALLQQCLADRVDYHFPLCGLHVWLEFPKDINLVAVFRRMEREKRHSLAPYMEPSGFYREPLQYLRFGFSALNPEESKSFFERLSVF